MKKVKTNKLYVRTYTQGNILSYILYKIKLIEGHTTVFFFDDIKRLWLVSSFVLPIEPNYTQLINIDFISPQTESCLLSADVDLVALHWKIFQKTLKDHESNPQQHQEQEVS